MIIQQYTVVSKSPIQNAWETLDDVHGGISNVKDRIRPGLTKDWVSKRQRRDRSKRLTPMRTKWVTVRAALPCWKVGGR